MYGRCCRKPLWAGASPLTLPYTHAAMQRLLGFIRGVMGCQRIVAAIPACLDIRWCASAVALDMLMRCTWSLGVQQWQICMALFHLFARHTR